jgi:hypothetical protein
MVAMRSLAVSALVTLSMFSCQLNQNSAKEDVEPSEASTNVSPPSNQASDTNFAIRNGDDASDVRRSVVMLATFDETTLVTNSATATAVRYKGCLLTAAHTPVSSKIFMSSSPGVRISSWTAQDISRRVPHPLYKSLPDFTQGAFVDLAVIWSGAMLNDPLKRYGMMALSRKDFLPWEISKIDTFTEPRGGELYGFGTTGIPSPSALRSGKVLIERFTAGVELGLPGASLTMVPGENDQVACGGDSGGPVLTDGEPAKVVGVISTASFYNGGGACADVDFNVATALSGDKSESTPGFTTSNYDWVNSTIELTCAKKISVIIQGMGEVVGIISPLQRSPLELKKEEVPLLNNSIETAKDDAVELVHEGQTFTMTAKAKTGAKFDKWQGCNGVCAERNPVCTVPYEKIGVSQQFTYNDESVCTAVFVPVPVSTDGYFPRWPTGTPANR